MITRIKIKADLGNVGDEDGAEAMPRNTQHHGQSALSLFPSSLCSAIVQIINLLDNAAVSDDGNAVYEVAYQVCLIVVRSSPSTFRVIPAKYNDRISNY